MCVADLKVTTQPCAHRWYELRRACHPANNLANCPEKLQLQGWENKTDTCPWCSDDSAVASSTHRLFGDDTSSASSASSTTGETRPSRSGSGSTVNSLSRHSSTASVESVRGQKHREMNERLHLYLLKDHHEVLPSAGKYYPTGSPTSPVEIPTPDTISLRNAGGVLGRGWKRSLRVSKNVFKS